MCACSNVPNLNCGPYSEALTPYPLPAKTLSKSESLEHDYSNSYSGSGGFDGADTLLEAR